MQEIITVTRRGQGSQYYEVATNARRDGASGSLGAFTKELEAIQFASRHCAQSRGAAAGAVLELTDEQQELAKPSAARQGAPMNEGDPLPGRLPTPQQLQIPPRPKA